MSNYDVAAGVLRTAVQQELRKTQLSERAATVNLVGHPLSKWDDVDSLDEIPARKIVHAIPHIISMKKRPSQVVDDETSDLLTGEYGAIPIVQESMKMFCSGTDEVTYQIKTSDTAVDIEYDPEKPPASSLSLDFFQVTGADGETTEDAESRTKSFCSLLELGLKLRSAGDVFIQGVPMDIIENVGVSMVRLTCIKERRYLKR